MLLGFRIGLNIIGKRKGGTGTFIPLVANGWKIPGFGVIDAVGEGASNIEALNASQFFHILPLFCRWRACPCPVLTIGQCIIVFTGVKHTHTLHIAVNSPVSGFSSINSVLNRELRGCGTICGASVKLREFLVLAVTETEPLAGMAPVLPVIVLKGEPS